MVSLNPTNETADENIIQPAQAVEDTFGEQYFPEQMSWYAPEGPQGLIEAGARQVRENPWLAMGVALAAGVVLALCAGPLIRAGAAGISLATGLKSSAADDETDSDCTCCGGE
jgi:hypothetical protein